MKIANTAYLGIGTNIGNRLKWIEQAIESLQATEGINVSRISKVYETSPVDYLDQPDFYNLVCEIQTDLTPLQLLYQVQQIEQKLKRVRKIRFGPRTIDIDILLYDEQIIQKPELTIPHPRMQNRAFVLIPLFELAPSMVIPSIQQPIAALLEQLPTDQIVRKADEQLEKLKGGSCHA